ncbi:MAG TPA: hypothetical protein VJR89_31115 [Polyangiales bacterium]|nr:hypothetical protein [Polyangiales bacterium]
MDMPNSAPYSHPNQPVRHSYPLSVQTADLTTAFALVLRTAPYALGRFGVLFGTSVVTLVWYVITFGGWVWLSKLIHPFAGVSWFIAGCVMYGYLWRTLVRYFLYMLKAGHIAVLTELITRGQLGDRGEGMFEYGKRIVTERFGQMNAMFALDLLVHGVVRAFNRTLNWIAGLLPIPGLRDLAGIVNAIVYSAATFIDETILSYSLARGDEDAVRSSRDGLIYYAQNSKEVLKTGLWIVVLDKVSTFLAWIVMLAPTLLVGAILPSALKGAGILFTLVMSGLLTWNLRAAFLEPLFLTMIMIKFHVSVHGQAINLEWDDRLSQVSGKFVELKNLIGKPSGVAPVPAPVTPA